MSELNPSSTDHLSSTATQVTLMKLHRLIVWIMTVLLIIIRHIATGYVTWSSFADANCSGVPMMFSQTGPEEPCMSTETCYELISYYETVNRSDSVYKGVSHGCTLSDEFPKFSEVYGNAPYLVIEEYWTDGCVNGSQRKALLADGSCLGDFNPYTLQIVVNTDGSVDIIQFNNLNCSAGGESDVYNISSTDVENHSCHNLDKKYYLFLDGALVGAPIVVSSAADATAFAVSMGIFVFASLPMVFQL